MLGHSHDKSKKFLIITNKEGHESMLEGYLFTVAGLICFFEGLPYLATPEQLKNWLQKISGAPSRYLRILGAVLMVVGLIFVYWGRRHGG
jgi:uncharacterized protein YjeT (DUF2065 family)